MNKAWWCAWRAVGVPEYEALQRNMPELLQCEEEGENGVEDAVGKLPCCFGEADDGQRREGGERFLDHCISSVVRKIVKEYACVDAEIPEYSVRWVDVDRISTCNDE